ncbi:MAG TPA: glycosyltransferase family 39 protein [Myxococcota bacterium]|nr:glycosyltransferase family 39 protein [Myxococcota bacterium]HQK51292.1 glycosyltransferase family 39 protein [Myxococcota bacterium]
MGPEASGSRWFLAGLLAILLGAGALQWTVQRQWGPVNDELANFPSGVALVRTGQHADPTHPPLARYLMAIPLLIAGVEAHEDSPDLGIRWHPYGRDFLFRNTLPWRTVLDLARLPILILSLATVAWTAWIARRRFGVLAGLFAGALLAFEPTFLAHGTLATTDLALTFWVLAAVLAFERLLQAPSGRRMLVFSAAFAGALLTKFAALALLPILGALGLAWRLRHGPLGLPGWRWHLASLGLVAGIIFACYRFEVRSIAEDPQVTAIREAEAVSRGLDRAAEALHLSTATLVSLPIPAYSFWKGLGAQVFHAARQDAWEDRNFYQYLDGEYRRTGFPQYYLMTTIYKSTLPFLALLAWGIAAGLSRLARRDHLLGEPSPGTLPALPTWKALVLVPLIWFLVCSLQSINIGHRYLLPAFPWIAMALGAVAAKACTTAWEARHRLAIRARDRLPTALAGAAAATLVVAHVGSGIAAWPDPLAYFNPLAGGPDNGWRHLADSNLDWGQDLPRLDADARAHCTGDSPCIASVFGAARPSDYGTPVQEWTPDQPLPTQPFLLYISENRYLLRSEDHPRGIFPFLGDRPPDRRVGASIRVYQVTPSAMGAR